MNGPRGAMRRPRRAEPSTAAANTAPAIHQRREHPPSLVCLYANTTSRNNAVFTRALHRWALPTCLGDTTTKEILNMTNYNIDVSHPATRQTSVTVMHGRAEGNAALVFVHLAREGSDTSYCCVIRQGEGETLSGK